MCYFSDECGHSDWQHIVDVVSSPSVERQNETNNVKSIHRFLFAKCFFPSRTGFKWKALSMWSKLNYWTESVWGDVAVWRREMLSSDSTIDKRKFHLKDLRKSSPEMACECLQEDFINVENIRGWRQWLTDERNVKTQLPTRFQQHLRSATLSSAIITFRVNELRKVSPKAREDDFCKLCRIFSIVGFVFVSQTGFSACLCLYF